jgi:hypothetical protein
LQDDATKGIRDLIRTAGRGDPLRLLETPPNEEVGELRQQQTERTAHHYGEHQIKLLEHSATLLRLYADRMEQHYAPLFAQLCDQVLEETARSPRGTGQEGEISRLLEGGPKTPGTREMKPDDSPD